MSKNADNKLPKWTSWVNVVQGIIVIFSIIIGGFFAFFQYHKFQVERRIDRAYELVDVYNSQEMVERRWEMSKLAQDSQDKMKEVKGLENDSERQPSIHKEIILEITKDRQSGFLLDYMTAFFYRVAICGESVACDGDVLKAYFMKESELFFDNFYPYLCQQISKGKDEVNKIQDYFIGNGKVDLCVKEDKR